MVTSYMWGRQPRGTWCLACTSSPHRRGLTSRGVSRHGSPRSRGGSKAGHRVQPSGGMVAASREKAEATERVAHASNKDLLTVTRLCQIDARTVTDFIALTHHHARRRGLRQRQR